MESSPKTEEQSRVEQLLRDAHIQRMRKQWAAAETLCREALAVAPNDAMGQEMLGDLLLEKGSLDEALELYRRALVLQPSRAVLEEKIARAVLQQDAERRTRTEAELFLSSPRKTAERTRGVTIAILLSLLCPGAGQLMLGQYVKGGIMLAVGLLGILLGSLDLLKFFLGMSGTLRRGEAPPNPMLTMLGLLGLIVYVYSLLDTASQASKRKVRGGDV